MMNLVMKQIYIYTVIRKLGLSETENSYGIGCINWTVALRTSQIALAVKRFIFVSQYLISALSFLTVVSKVWVSTTCSLILVQ